MKNNPGRQIIVKNFIDYPFKSMVSLAPLLHFWEKNLVPECQHMAYMFKEIKQKISENSEILDNFHDILNPLMSAVFPPASFNTQIAGALAPCTFEPFFVTPQFQKLFIDGDKFLKRSIQQDNETARDKMLLRIFFLVLGRIYGMDIQGLNNATTRIVSDEKSGLDRYYSIVPDFQFVDVIALKEPNKLSNTDLAIIEDNITDIKIYPYGEREINEATPPYEYSTNNGTVDIVEEVDGDTSIPVGGSLSLTYSYFYDGIIIPLDPVTLTMTTNCDYSVVDTSSAGYYLLECTGQDRKGLVLNLDFGRVITVGDPNAENYPTEHIKYNYSTDWLDQLANYETITYNTDGTVNSQSTVQTYIYDDQGNPIEITEFYYNGNYYDNAVLEYDGRQLTNITLTDLIESTVIVSYTYNDQGYRTSKTINNTTIEYHLQGDKVLLETDGTYAIIYTYDYDGRLISFNYDSDKNEGPDGVEYYYLRNQQGDITKIVNKYGVVIVEYTYDAWGNIINTVDTSGINLSEINPYRYRGYRYDEEIAMYYLNSRFYDANVGRLINADGLMGNQGNILGHNMYSYTSNNYVSYTDPSGYFGILLFGGALVLVLVLLLSGCSSNDNPAGIKNPNNKSTVEIEITDDMTKDDIERELLNEMNNLAHYKARQVVVNGGTADFVITGINYIDFASQVNSLEGDFSSIYVDSAVGYLGIDGSFATIGGMNSHNYFSSASYSLFVSNYGVYTELWDEYNKYYEFWIIYYSTLDGEGK